MKENDWATVQKRCRGLKTFGIELLCKNNGIKPLLKDVSDPLTFLGAVLLPQHLNMNHMKDWLYDNRNIEVVVHKQLGFNILRFSVHVHTSEEDILALDSAVREYL